MYKLSPAEFIRVMEVYHTCPLLLEALRQIRREKEIPKPEDPATFSAVFVAEKPSCRYLQGGFIILVA